MLLTTKRMTPSLWGLSTPNALPRERMTLSPNIIWFLDVFAFLVHFLCTGLSSSFYISSFTYQKKKRERMSISATSSIILGENIEVTSCI